MYGYQNYSYICRFIGCIVCDTESLAFVCMKKDNSNPVLSADEKGKLVRSHGELFKISEHLLSILNKMEDLA